MNIKAILASLVLGSSSVAMASPGTTFHAGGTVSVGTNAQYPAAAPRAIVRDHRGSDDWWARDDRTPVAPAPLYSRAAYGTQPVDDCDNISGSYYHGRVGRMPASGHASIALTAPTKIANGREIINLGTDRGVMTQLTLRANSGSTFIRSVEVTMGKGDLQTVQVNQWLNTRNPTFSFDVDGRRGRVITQIVVNGESSFGSRYHITSER